MKIFLRLLRWAVVLASLLAAVVLVHLAVVWWNDPKDALKVPRAGVEDAGRFSHGQPAEVVKVKCKLEEAEKQLSELILRCVAEKRHLAIAGAKHSMGGQTMSKHDAVVVDMLGLRHMCLDDKKKELTVGAGALWKEVIPYLREQKHAVAVMQSNSDFSVGGSLSVNCHGWQHNSGPIASTVRSLRVITADGQVHVCGPDTEPELFRLVLGGYGLFGIITEATLAVVEDEIYVPRTVKVTPDKYNCVFHELTTGDEAQKRVGMAYGRINTAPLGFLQSGTITLLERDAQVTEAGEPNAFMQSLKRLVFRGGVGSAFGKQLRWIAETQVGESAGGFLPGKKPAQWRHDIMAEPAALFGNHDPSSREILHEYFIPAGKLEAFLQAMRPVVKEHRPDLLNITVRNVMPDNITFLNYTRDLLDQNKPAEVFGLVMLFHLQPGDEADAAMGKFTVAMIDAALSCGGTYYLPYRLHATPRQLRAAYPQAPEFFRLKRQRDPNAVFTNQWFEQYASQPELQ
ncbi:MAG: FAD-binding oxidoreductase [Verrucomicrobiaceae bacterium]